MAQDMGQGVPFQQGAFDGVIRCVHVCVRASNAWLQRALCCCSGSPPHSAFFFVCACLRVYSVSALQWICNQDKSSHNPVQRMKQFFTTLYSSMVRAVFCMDLHVNSMGRIAP